MCGLPPPQPLVAILRLVHEMQDAGGAVLAGRPITWTSDALSIATVSASGVVTAVADGIARSPDVRGVRRRMRLERR